MPGFQAKQRQALFCHSGHACATHVMRVAGGDSVEASMLPTCTDSGCLPCTPQTCLVLPSSERTGDQGCSGSRKPW